MTRKNQSKFEPKLTDDQKVIVKLIIARLRVRKVPLLEVQKAIYEATGETLALSTISDYQKKINKEWQQEYLGTINAYKAAELAKLDQMEAETWEQWERSKLNAVTHTVEHVALDEEDAAALKKTPAPSKSTFSINPEDPDPRPDPKETRIEVKSKETTRTVGQCGDPRYQAILIDISARRAKLLGLDAPTKIAPTDPSGENEYGDLTDDQLQQGVLAILNQAATGQAGQVDKRAGKKKN